MRIIHTADWHLGATLAGHDREPEHRAALADLTRIVVATRADALIVAGDVFDSQNPSGASQALLYQALASLHKARPSLEIILTAGNHDAAGRLEAPRALLGAVNTRVVGNVRRRAGHIDVDPHLMAVHGASGAVEIYVLAVSYPTAGCLPPFNSLASPQGSPVVAATARMYAEMIDQVRPKLGGLPLIVTGHLHVQGAAQSEGAERRILVGGEHAVPPAIFPPDVAYVALGHLHKAQAVGRETIRYSGSLFPLSASELHHIHGVTLVTLEGGKVWHEHIPIPRPVAFRRVPAEGFCALEELPQLLEAVAGDVGSGAQTHPFVQVALRREGLAAGFRTGVDDLGQRLPVRLLPAILSPLSAQQATRTTAEPTTRLSDLSPDDLFLDIFKRANGIAPNEEHSQVFHRVRAQAGS